MHLFDMLGSWGPVTAWMYETIVVPSLAPLYDRFVAEAVPEQPEGAAIIDVGCGQGQVASRLAARFPRCRVTGLDLSPDMIRRAREHNPDRDNLDFRRGDAMALPLDDQTADFAVSVASIKHWPDRVRGVSELLRVLRPGGMLCLLEADRDCSPESARRFADLWRHVVPGDAAFQAFYFRRFVAGAALNLDELAGVLARAGAVELEAQRFTDLPFVVARARSRPPG